MKRFMNYSFLVALMCFTALAGHARNINIDANTIKGDFTMQLRAMCAQASYNDTVVITFGKGTYTLDGTIVLRSHVIIKGAGKNKTTVMLDKGSSRGGQKAFPDDTFIKVFGTLRHPVSVDISDIYFKLKDHDGIWWLEGERYGIKIYHGNRVRLHNVDSHFNNAHITNVDMHVCSNVTVTGCTFTNYNNSETGGCLWIRGEMHNVTVKGNKFFKYGKDESLAIYDRVVDNTDKYVRGVARRTNIIVEDNEFHYGGYKGKNKDLTANCGMVFSLFTDELKSEDKCTTEDFHLRNNTFYVNDVCSRCIYIGFDPADSHKNIFIENNRIINGKTGRDDKYYHQDIEVHDLSSNPDVIHITGNKIENSNIVINQYGTQGYDFLMMRGGNVVVDGNQIVNRATVNPENGKNTGVELIKCSTGGGIVNMTNNVFKGIKFIATVEASKGIESFTLNASNNYFSGDTRIYCNKVKELNLNFTNNTLVSNDMNFFLQEFAEHGTLVFNNNKVSVATGNGQLMTHWSKHSTDKMRFDRLEVKNNVFKGVKSERELFKNFTNVKKRSVGYNTISR